MKPGDRVVVPAGAGSIGAVIRENGGIALVVVNLDRGGVSNVSDMACVRPEDEKPDPRSGQ